jgi:carbon-monoxide dehydrogenase medium subunit
VLLSRRGQRRVAAREFFVGALVTQRQPDEILTALEWPRSAPDTGHAFTEIAQRHGDFAIAAAACGVRLGKENQVEGLSLAIGGVEDRPVAIDVNSFLGRPAAEMAADLSEHAAASVNPMEDHSASADYRIALTKVLVERAVNVAVGLARRRRNRPQ